MWKRKLIICRRLWFKSPNHTVKADKNVAASIPWYVLKYNGGDGFVGIMLIWSSIQNGKLKVAEWRVGKRGS